MQLNEHLSIDSYGDLLTSAADHGPHTPITTPTQWVDSPGFFAPTTTIFMSPLVACPSIRAVVKKFTNHHGLAEDLSTRREVGTPIISSCCRHPAAFFIPIIVVGEQKLLCNSDPPGDSSTRGPQSPHLVAGTHQRFHPYHYC